MLCSICRANLQSNCKHPLQCMSPLHLRCIACRPDDGTARLQHLPTGAIISIIKPDLQSGQAVAHVVDSLLSPDQAASVAAEQGSASGGPGGRYASAMAVLQDPAQQLLGFAGLVQQAGMAAELSEYAAALTLFVPSNEVRRQASCADVVESCSSGWRCEGVT